MSAGDGGTCSGSTSQAFVTAHRKGHRRQESFYEMTGLYSEMRGPADGDGDSSSAEIPNDTDENTTPPGTQLHMVTSTNVPDTVIKCHSRQPSSGLVTEKQLPGDDDDEDEDDMSRDCGILSFRPQKIQKLARIKVDSSHCIHFSNFTFFLFYFILM